MHIVVVRAGSVSIKLLIEIVEAHLNSSTTGQLLFVTSAHYSLGVEATGNHVLVSRNEVIDHVPKQLLLMSFLMWHWWSKVTKIIFCLLTFGFDFHSNFW